MNNDNDPDIQETLDWCAKHEVVFKITNQAGRLVVTLKHANIFAEQFIDAPYSYEKVGRAVQASLFSVMSGVKFHAEYGHFPPTQAGLRPAPVGDEASEAATRNSRERNNPDEHADSTA